MKIPFWICHQKPERCFKFHNKPLPLCSRCIGLYLSLILGFLLSYLIGLNIYLNKQILIKLSILLILPLVIDGFTQFLHLRESNNWLRFITGVLAGFVCGVDLAYLIFKN